MDKCCDKHDPCEGGPTHIRGRDKNGCAQFQDGSWITRHRSVCSEEHPGPDGIGIGDVWLAQIEGATDRAWRQRI